MLFAAATLLAFSACKGPEAKQGNTPPDTPLVVNAPPASTTPSTAATATADGIITTDQYSIALPQGWQRKDKVSDNFQMVMLVAPPADGYNPNLNVLRDNMNGRDLEGYISFNLQKMAKMNLTNQKSGDMEINGGKAKFLTYSYQMEGKDIAIKTYVVPKDGSAYVLTGSCLLSQVDTYMPEFDKIAQSFKLK